MEKSKWREFENFLNYQMQSQPNNNQNQEILSIINQLSEAYHIFKQKIDQIQSNFENYQIEMDARIDDIKSKDSFISTQMDTNQDLMKLKE